MKKKIEIGKSTLEIEIKKFRERTLKDNITLSIVVMIVLIGVYLVIKK